MNSVAQWRKSLLSTLLKADGIIAYPTEGVWGLGCLPESRAAVERILRLKNRGWEQGLIVVAASMDQLEPYLQGLNRADMKELESGWPGPVTYLVPDNAMAPSWIVGRHSTLGLRIADHPVMKDLCECVGPLVSTSANITSRPAATSALEVRRYFGSKVDHIVPGKLGGAAGPSQIKVLTTGEIIR